MPVKQSIFISHSSKDEQIVSLFIEKILNVGLGITRDSIFYTSSKDTGIKSGDDFKKAIKQRLINATTVIQIITQNYKESEVCLNEMGAAWVLCDKVVPFIVDPIRFDNVGFIHNTTQLLRLNKSEDLFQFQDDNEDLYVGRKINQSNYHRQVNEFVKNFEGGRFGLNQYGFNIR
jgi:hypothetical protein